MTEMVEVRGVATKRATGTDRTFAFGALALIAAIAVAPFFVYPVFLMKFLCFALLVCAYNLLSGYVGLVSFGHAAFFGMGCYVSAWAVKYWDLTPELAILSAGVFSAVLGLAIGAISIKRKGLVFAMITLALAQMVYFFCVETPYTRGENGVQDVPRGKIFGLFSLTSDMSMYWFTAAIFLVGFLLIHRIVHSPFGEVLKAIRENENRATSLGYDIYRYKLVAFILSSGLAGAAGGLKTIVFGIATLTDVHFSMSGDILMMSLVGGVGTIFGPVFGALIGSAMQDYLASLGSWVVVAQGAVFVLCVLLFRRGLVGEAASQLKLKL